MEALFRERGVDVSYETVRFRWNRFGPMLASENVDRQNIIQQQKSLLHVAATRAKRALRVSWIGVSTEFFKYN